MFVIVYKAVLAADTFLEDSYSVNNEVREFLGQTFRYNFVTTFKKTNTDIGIRREVYHKKQSCLGLEPHQRCESTCRTSLFQKVVLHGR